MFISKFIDFLGLVSQKPYKIKKYYRINLVGNFISFNLVWRDYVVRTLSFWDKWKKPKNGTRRHPLPNGSKATGWDI